MLERSDIPNQPELGCDLVQAPNFKLSVSNLKPIQTKMEGFDVFGILLLWFIALAGYNTDWRTSVNWDCSGALWVRLSQPLMDVSINLQRDSFEVRRQCEGGRRWEGYWRQVYLFVQINPLIITMQQRWFIQLSCWPWAMSRIHPFIKE